MRASHTLDDAGISFKHTGIWFKYIRNFFQNVWCLSCVIWWLHSSLLLSVPASTPKRTLPTNLHLRHGVCYLSHYQSYIEVSNFSSPFCRNSALKPLTMRKKRECGSVSLSFSHQASGEASFRWRAAKERSRET